MQDANQRAVGVELNGHVWDGAQWVPVPPARQDGPGAGARHSQMSSGAAAPLSHLWQQRLPQPGGFTDPHYGYGLTRQTSDDLQFIARFFKIMIIIWIVLHLLTLVLAPFLLGSLFAALGSLLTHVPR